MPHTRRRLFGSHSLPTRTTFCRELLVHHREVYLFRLWAGRDLGLATLFCTFVTCESEENAPQSRLGKTIASVDRVEKRGADMQIAGLGQSCQLVRVVEAAGRGLPTTVDKQGIMN